MAPRTGASWARAAPAWMLATFVAGCSTPSEELQTCQWTEGNPGTFVTGGFFTDPNDNERHDDLGGDATEFDGRPLTAIALDFHDYTTPSGAPMRQGLQMQDGRVTVRFERLDDGRPLTAYRDSQLADTRLEWTFGPGETLNTTLTVPLEEENGTLVPTGIRATWTFERNLDGNPSTQSSGVLRYHAVQWYKDCFTASA